jgi:hypothetical protein
MATREQMVAEYLNKLGQLPDQPSVTITLTNPQATVFKSHLLEHRNAHLDLTMALAKAMLARSIDVLTITGPGLTPIVIDVSARPTPPPAEPERVWPPRPWET